MTCLQCFDTVGWVSEEHLTCKKLSDKLLVWLSAWSMLQIVCIWSSWCHCHPKTPSSLDSFKSRLVLTFWYWLTQVASEKRPLNGCSVAVVKRWNVLRNNHINFLQQTWLKNARPVGLGFSAVHAQVFVDHLAATSVAHYRMATTIHQCAVSATFSINYA